MTDPDPDLDLDLELDDAEHTAQTRDAYDRLAPVWSAATDDGPFNGGLERPSTTLASFATVLRPGGWVVLSLDHPFGAPVAGQRGGYFDTELVTDTWRKAGVEVTQRFWRRPLAATVDAFGDAGFAVDRVVETRPDVAARPPLASRIRLDRRRPHLHRLPAPSTVMVSTTRAQPVAAIHPLRTGPQAGRAKSG